MCSLMRLDYVHQKQTHFVPDYQFMKTGRNAYKFELKIHRRAFNDSNDLQQWSDTRLQRNEVKRHFLSMDTSVNRTSTFGIAAEV